MHSNLADAKNLISEAEFLARIIDIAAARDDTFEAVTIRDVARQAWRKLIEAVELGRKGHTEMKRTIIELGALAAVSTAVRAEDASNGYHAADPIIYNWPREDTTVVDELGGESV